MTASIRRILCAIDLERTAPSVLSCAASLATTFGARLEALHVRRNAERAPWALFQSGTHLVESLMTANAVEQHLSRVVDDAHAGVHVSKRVLDGATASTIMAEADRSEADLLVVGASARWGSGWWQRPGTACELSSRARCAVLTVPVDAPAEFARRILLPVDFSIGTEVALEWTVLLARIFGSHVDVLHALPAERTDPHTGAPAARRPRLTAALTRLAATVARLRGAGVSDTTSVLVEGDTLDAILARNQSESSDLIVMGMHDVTPPAHQSDARSGNIACVRASLAVSVLSVRGPQVTGNRDGLELPRRSAPDRTPQASFAA
jgi:nucleotide-binding universal stress UspA family protein